MSDHEVEITIDINDVFHCDVATTVTSNVNIPNNQRIEIINSPEIEIQGGIENNVNE